jgi:hypothetical protein
MSYLIRIGYVLFAAGVLTPIFGGVLDRDLHREHHFYFSSFAAVLCLLGLLAVGIGRHDRRRQSQGSGKYGSR